MIIDDLTKSEKKGVETIDGALYEVTLVKRRLSDDEAAAGMIPVDAVPIEQEATT